MKNTTISSDLTKYITEVARRTEADRARARAIEMLDSIDPQQVHAAAEAYRDAKTTCAAASAIVAAIPKSRRDAAKILHDSALGYARDIAHRLGGSYSGATRIAAQWGEQAAARTTTDTGGRYSRSCIYRKTDAKHIITLSADTTPYLMQSEHIRVASSAEGLRLISLTPAGQCTWVRSKGKALVSEAGWIAYSPDSGGTCYHSTQSRAHAEVGAITKALHYAPRGPSRSSEPQGDAPPATHRPAVPQRGGDRGRCSIPWLLLSRHRGIPVASRNWRPRNAPRTHADRRSGSPTARPVPRSAGFAPTDRRRLIPNPNPTHE
jgi:hypothetical protein